MTARLAVFRCDASPSIGAGHVMRCFALAESAVTAGFRIAFAMTEGSLNCLPVALPQSWGSIVVSGEPTTEPSEIGRAIDADCVELVVDHYHRGASFEQACSEWAHRVVAWEDVPNRTHACDIVLDTAASPGSDDYARLVPARTRVLAGPRYVPLRSEFMGFRTMALQRRQSCGLERIFVSFGATTTTAVLLAIDAIRTAGLDVQIDVAIGAAAPDLEAVLAREDGRVRVHIGADNVAELMTEADLAVGAAGTTAWERCCLGLPTIVLTVADNQARIASLLAKERAAEYLGAVQTTSISRLADALATLARNAPRRKAMASAAAALVDGAGGARVWQEICQ